MVAGLTFALIGSRFFCCCLLLLEGFERGLHALFVAADRFFGQANLWTLWSGFSRLRCGATGWLTLWASWQD